ncbi:MAG: DUF58 domain-containing protein [Bacteroidia bacterium]|nr:DUF58 domain-containing protein [Bacteroidia bacterium]
MDTTQIFRNVRQIEIRTRGLVNQLFSGEYHSVFKGRGMEFTEVREYNYGDDVRTIDWNVSARFNRPFVKVFEEERELTVMLLVDMSGSQDFGTMVRKKREIAAELCAVLAFSAIKNNDKVGMVIFTDRVETFIPPKKGRSHILRIIRDILAYQPQGNGTNLKAALEYFTSVTKKRSIVFLVSDFIDDGYQRPMKIAARKHDLIAVRLIDAREADVPDVGLVKLRDAESGSERWIDTSQASVRKAWRENWERRFEAQSREFLISNVDAITIDARRGYVQPLVEFFRMREKRYR